MANELRLDKELGKIFEGRAITTIPNVGNSSGSRLCTKDFT